MVVFCSLKLFPHHAQIELSALYWILSHGWMLRMMAEGEGDLSFANLSLCRTVLTQQ